VSSTFSIVTANEAQADPSFPFSQDVYHGNRGNVMNPQSSAQSKAVSNRVSSRLFPFRSSFSPSSLSQASQQVMSDFSKTSAALNNGYNGTKQNVRRCLFCRIRRNRTLTVPLCMPQPQASPQAQANASTRQGDLPKWTGA